MKRRKGDARNHRARHRRQAAAKRTPRQRAKKHQAAPRPTLFGLPIVVSDELKTPGEGDVVLGRLEDSPLLSERKLKEN